MSPCKKAALLLGTTFILGFFSNSQAQEKVDYKEAPLVKLDVCKGEARVLSQQQTAKGIELEVEISVADCDGNCTGTLEYDMLFTDANNNDVLWHMSDGWDWRSVGSPFKLQLQQKSLPNATLKSIPSMKIGRCSCSTVEKHQ